MSTKFHTLLQAAISPHFTFVQIHKHLDEHKEDVRYINYVLHRLLYGLFLLTGEQVINLTTYWLDPKYNFFHSHNVYYPYEMIRQVLFLLETRVHTDFDELPPQCQVFIEQQHKHLTIARTPRLLQWVNRNIAPVIQEHIGTHGDIKLHTFITQTIHP